MAKEDVSAQLVKDYALIWPVPDAEGNLPKVNLRQAWQDTEVVPIHKGKGSRNDPTNYRGIFQLDVLRKILSSVMNARLQTVVDQVLGDEQNGFRAA